MSPTVLPAAPRDDGKIKGRHVLMAIVAFFATIFAVNGVLVYEAISTHTGLVSQEPYRKGLHYNSRIEADARQRELGWQDTVQIEPNGDITVRMLDSLGGPVGDLQLVGYVGRPSTTHHDIKFALTETQPGHYSANVGALEGGAWMIVLDARRSVGGTEATGEPSYRLKRRLWLKP